MLLDTGADRTFVNQEFEDPYKVATTPSMVPHIVIADIQVININLEARPL